MPRKAQGWITFQSSEEERQILEKICQQTQRTKTEILREMLRQMGQAETMSAVVTEPKLLPEDEADEAEELVAVEGTILQSVKLSARNILKATIKRVVRGSVNAEVTLVIAPGIELVSIITRSSADALKLRKGKMVFAVIKSNSVILAEA